MLLKRILAFDSARCVFVSSITFVAVFYKS